MTMTAKWRSLLAMLLVFAVSPPSMRASTVCDISCSSREVTVPGSRLNGPAGRPAVTGSVKHDAGMHCHSPADSDESHSAALRNRQGRCHKDKCLSAEVVVIPAFARGKCTRPSQVIPTDLSTVPLAKPSPARRDISPNSRTRLAEVFAASGILRI
jgi:hypothetical protein